LEAEETEAAISLQVAVYGLGIICASVDGERTAKNRPVKRIISFDILKS
jgi:hypothetical protein